MEGWIYQREKEISVYTPQPKLAGATVRLLFDDEGKLHTITN
ncbi:hypothetical protein [Agrobacterium tumefaciens]|nr:hypothetical protein [Agrobacterium tumefaciens]